MKLIVSGASGDLGGRVARQLLDLVPAEDLILLTRNPDGLADLAARGAEVRAADFDRPGTLATALSGGERMLLVSTIAVGPTRRAQHRAAIDAAKAAGVRRLAYTSCVGIHPRNPSFIVPDHTYTEALLRDCGMETTILHMGSYADILARAIVPQALASGHWVSRSGDGRLAHVAKDDCARAAAHVLADDGHAGAVYEITGPELMSNREAAALAAEMAGRPIAYLEPSSADEEEVAKQAAAWVGPFTLADLLSSELAVRDGFNAICSDHVEMITGTPAKALRQVYAEAGIGS
ncbi:MAG: NAD(P)H-binding protein [Novosphingobium sp.]|nr:NAD(P)H-binding protein [Novosphingobium sp.]